MDDYETVSDGCLHLEYNQSDAWHFCQGQVNICLPKFLPASPENLTRLGRVIQAAAESASPGWTPSDIWREISDWITEEIKTIDPIIKEDFLCLETIKKTVAIQTRAVKEKKNAAGIPYTKDDLDREKESLKYIRKIYRETERAYKDKLNRKTRLEKNRTRIQKWIKDEED